MKWLFEKMNKSAWAVRIYILVIAVPVVLFVLFPMYAAVHLYYFLRDLGYDVMFLADKMLKRWKMGYLGDEK